MPKEKFQKGPFLFSKGKKKKYVQSKMKWQLEEAFSHTSRSSSNAENKKRTFLRTSIKYKVPWNHSHPFLKFSRLSFSPLI